MTTRRSPALSLLSVLAAPAAAVYGAALAFRMYHPPRRPHHRTPGDVGLPVTERYVELPDRGRLHIWLCEADRNRVVVLGHGIGLSKSAALAHAKLLHDAGYTVCLFDHRNHGASSAHLGFRRLGELFTTDIVAVVAMLRASEPYRNATIAVFGFSFSTFPSVNALARAGFAVDAIICDSGPADDGRSLFERFLAAGALPLPGVFAEGVAGAVTRSVMTTTAQAMLGVDWPPRPTAVSGRVPALLLCGEHDRITTTESVRALAARFPRFRVETLPGAGHLNGLKHAPRHYRELVLGFLDQTLGTPDDSSAA